jgi:high-affinity iron transporter
MKFKFRIAANLLGLVALLACGTPRPGPRPTAPDGGDAQRLALLLDYVGGDYGRAVRAGTVISAAEYDEQVRFVLDASSLAERLLGSDVPRSDSLHVRIATVSRLVRDKAGVDEVGRACQAARDETIERFGLQRMPGNRPDLARARTLYVQNCAVCHGPDGRAHTERAKTLDPPPASFHDPERLALLSPFRVYNALTFGVPGTGMASFDSFTSDERWDLAFFIFRLGHEGEAAQGPVGLSLAELAARSDRELLGGLRSEQHPLPEAALAYARRESPFVAPPTALGAARTREMVGEAVAAYAAGRKADAERLAIDAYLQGFEPLEAQLRARDPQATLDVETAFRDLRAALAGSATARVRASADSLNRLLIRVAQDGEARVVPFVAAALIYFREGIEAALLVGALLAGLRKLGRADAGRYVHYGWLAALPAGVLTWFLFERVLALGADRRELLEGVVALVAAAVLFSVSFWMISQAESRRWLAYLRRNLEETISKRNLGLIVGLAFLAVYREAAETVLFTQALLFDAVGQRAHVWLGALAGTAAAAAAAWMMNRTVLRLPLAPFFGVSGLLLCLLSMAFAGSGVYVLVQSGFLPSRPVAFPEVAWLGVYPDLTGLLVQLLIVTVIAWAALGVVRRSRAAAER